ncbi:hypothetical protein JCM19241_4154 [Vibrio ishigakensis]|uniref:Uncharacterized protein n=1 Tax=Vibrio ishigakensis TaxID=1481914 RepID=A0A0B8QHR5_9VIBR|nr:hypothetical protein JCM19241_4154 [Vibrio ishigakensis]
MQSASRANLSAGITKRTGVVIKVDLNVGFLLFYNAIWASKYALATVVTQVIE